MHSYFSSFIDFIHMGHYADYVWSAYLIVFVFLFALLLRATRKSRKLVSELRKVHADQS